MNTQDENRSNRIETLSPLELPLVQITLSVLAVLIAITQGISLWRHRASNERPSNNTGRYAVHRPVIDEDQALQNEARDFRSPSHSPIMTIALNEAGTGELSLLPGIGPKLAARIIQHRRQHGPFRSWRQVDEVNGLGPATIAGIRPFCVLDRPAR